MIITEWENCYPSNWKGVISPAAMAHPAKYSSKLIRRIYEHMLEMGWIKSGDKVLDPFGGIALGALDAMRLGLNWYGVELEAKFAGLGTVNILEWNSRFGSMPRWGSAHLFNGDSRKLIKIVQGSVSAAVSSPPYESDVVKARSSHLEEGRARAKGLKRASGMTSGALAQEQYGTTPGQLGNMRGDFSAAISSPPFVDSLSTDLLNKEERTRRARELGISDAANVSPIDMEKIGMRHQSDYGITPGQLGAMKAGDFNASISSPPFLQSEGGQPEPKPGGAIDERLYKRHAAGNKSSNAYGESDGQLSSMKDGGFDAAISSPPYADSDQNYKAGWERFHTGREPLHTNDIQREAEYGTTPGQLSAMPAGNFDASISSPPYDETRVGKESWQEHCGHGDQYGEAAGQLGGADDFWLAARAIVEQVYQALEPGGHAVWVVKDYVKAKKIVPFCDQWRQLCEAVGFVTEHEHHAMLVHHKGTQHTLEGGTVERKTESKSFFRRLAEKNGSPRIDWETVLCMTKL